MKKDMEKKRQDKKSQVSVFIIIGLIIIVIAVVLFINRSNLASLILGKTPVEQIKSCSLENLKEGMTIVSMQGGVIAPENYYLYKGNKIEYICYTEESFKKCVMQKPLLKNTIEEELVSYVKPRVNECLSEVKSSLERSGKKVSYKEPIINVSVSPEIILMNIELGLTIEKNGETESYKDIKTDINSEMYNLIITAGDIANSEANYGDADTTSLMIKDKTLKVEKIKQQRIFMKR